MSIYIREEQAITIPSGNDPTFVAVISNIPLVHTNVGEQLASVDDIRHRITIDGSGDVTIDFDKSSFGVKRIGVVYRLIIFLAIL